MFLQDDQLVGRYILGVDKTDDTPATFSFSIQRALHLSGPLISLYWQAVPIIPCDLDCTATLTISEIGGNKLKCEDTMLTVKLLLFYIIGGHLCCMYNLNTVKRQISNWTLDSNINQYEQDPNTIS